MLLTFILALSGCVLLFLMILAATITMPFSALVKNFPVDVQRRLQFRINTMPMSPKRIFGRIILILLMLAWAGLFVAGGIDGRANGFSYWQFVLRFLIIAAAVKVFDIVCLDYFLLTKTHFFQHFFPETEGCKGWQQFGYNWKTHLAHVIAFVFISALLAWVCTLI